MINRYIHGILTVGITNILEDTTFLDELFKDNYVIDESEAEAIKTYFLENGCRVKNGYPRKDTVWPAIHIVLGMETESDHFLSDSAGKITDDEDPNYGKELLAAIWEHGYRLIICTEHPDITVAYYEIAKFIMLQGLDVLLGDGCFEFHFSGKDMAPDERYIPAHLFVRELIFQCNREFQHIKRDTDLFNIRKVEGIHVDSSGSPSDVGNVKTNVTTYQEDTE